MRTDAIPHDKLLHVIAGTLTAGAGVLIALLAAQAGYSGDPAWFGVGACVAAAMGREAINHRQGGRFDWRDIAATLLGGAAVVVPVALL